LRVARARKAPQGKGDPRTTTPKAAVERESTSPTAALEKRVADLEWKLNSLAAATGHRFHEV